MCPSSSMVMRLLGLVLVVATGLVGCGSTIEAPRPLPGAILEPFVGLHAGAATVDITPAPGAALHGHGPAGRLSDGTMTRLRCQPVVLAEGDEALALVPCDLAWPSFVLQRQVAARVAELMAGDDRGTLGPERIAIMATHTHGAPGHHFPAPNYSGMMSSLNPGYSEDVTRYLADAIACGIVQAWRQLRPAAARWGSSRVHGLSKNRSLDAFAENLLTADEQRAFGPDGDLAALRPASRVVDPELSVLRLDADPSGEAIAALAIFGVHPTALPNFNTLYHGDVFGFAIRAFAEDGGRRVPVLGIANGLSGDVSPAVDFQGTREAKRLGADLARAIRQAYDGADAPVRRPLRAAYQEVHVPGAKLEPDAVFFASVDAIMPWPPLRTGADRDVLCLDGELGLVASGGAEDGRTLLGAFGDMYTEGSPGASAPDATGCHAPKRFLHGMVGAPQPAFPVVAPFHAAIVGDGLIVTYPAEISTLSGLRGRDRLLAWLGERARSRAPGVEPVPRRVVQTTLTTEYFQYVASDDEYERQNYEGASTLYGRGSARFMANEHLCLARHLVDGQTCHRDPNEERELEDPELDRTLPLEWRAKTGDVDPHPRACEGLSRLTRRQRFTRDGEEGWSVEVRAPAGCSGPAHVPRVSIRADRTGTCIDDDEGTGLTVRWVEHDIPGGCSPAAEARGGCPYWEVGWLPDTQAHARWAAAGGGAARFDVSFPGRRLGGVSSACVQRAKGGP